MKSNYITTIIRKLRTTKISAFVLSAIFTSVWLMLISLGVAYVNTHFSDQAAMELAEQLTHVMKEKTTLVVRTGLSGVSGVSSAFQSSLLIAAEAPLPFEDKSGSSWYQKWQTWGVLVRKSLGKRVNAITFAFDDGSYLAVADNTTDSSLTVDTLVTWRLLGTNSPIPSNASNLPWSRVDLDNYNYSTMEYMNSINYLSRIEPRLRAHYNRSLGPFAVTFSSSVVTTIGLPTLTVAYTMYNVSRHFLGMGELRLNLDSIVKNLIETKRPTSGSHALILDRNRNVIASSVQELSIFVSRTVPPSYILSSADDQAGCSLQTPSTTYKILLCLTDYATYGFGPLNELGSRGIIPASGDSVSATGKVNVVNLGDSGRYFVAVTNFNAQYSSLDWISIDMIPEHEILSGIEKGRKLSIAVGCALTVCVAIANGFMLRLLLRPLAGIAHQMMTGTYLADERPTKKGLAKNSLTKKQTLSHISEVSAIQKAYGDMTDELRLLRGYIPEHVRNQLIQAFKSSSSITASDIGHHSSDFSEMDLSAAGAIGSQIHLPVCYDHELQASPGPSPLSTNLPPDGAEVSSDSDVNGGAGQSKDMSYSPTTYADNNLVERSISVVAVNITGFHHYVRTSPIQKVVAEHESFVSYLHETAKRFGGVLDTFNGDKFWISFNATTPCEDYCVAATVFANEVANTVNKEAFNSERHLRDEARAPGKPPLHWTPPRTLVAARGVTIGVAAGSAFVGTLGNAKIRRHTINGNAIAEASALERMAARYPDCYVMVGEELIPSIEGYFQYLILDATALPGTRGQRRYIASVKSRMLSPAVAPLPFLWKGLPGGKASLPYANPFAAINECFTSFLEGKTVNEVRSMLALIRNYVDLSRHTKAQFRKLPDGRPVLNPLECDNMTMMLECINSLVGEATGENYCSALGGLFERS